MMKRKEFNEWAQEWLKETKKQDKVTTQQCKELRAKLNRRIKKIVEDTINEHLPNKDSREELERIEKVKKDALEKQKKERDNIIKYKKDLEKLMKRKGDIKALENYEKKSYKLEISEKKFKKAYLAERKAQWDFKGIETCYNSKYITKEEEEFYRFLLRQDENRQAIIPYGVIKNGKWECIKIEDRLSIIGFILDLQKYNHWLMGDNQIYRLIFRLLYPIRYRICEHAQEIIKNLEYHYDDDDSLDDINDDELKKIEKKLAALREKINKMMTQTDNEESIEEMLKRVIK